MNNIIITVKILDKSGYTSNEVTKILESSVDPWQTERYFDQLRDEVIQIVHEQNS